MEIISKNHTNSLDKAILRQPASKIDQLLSCLRCGLLNNKSVVSVIHLTGIIGKVGSFKSGLTLHALNSVIEKAFSFKKLTAVCLVINSPGGSPVQSELIASRILQLSNQKNVPVYSFVEDVAASGGYWLACAGKKIYASKSSIIGSIGVIYMGFGLHDAIGKLGIKRRVYTSGNNKSILDPFMPEKDSDVKIIQNLQKKIHNHFISYIKSRRGDKITQEDKVIYNGEFWSGEQALEYGLIDGINDMYSFLNTKYGDSIKIEYVSTKQSWIKRKLGLIIDIGADSLVQKTLKAIEYNASTNKYDLH